MNFLCFYWISLRPSSTTTRYTHETFSSEIWLTLGYSIGLACSLSFIIASSFARSDTRFRDFLEIWLGLSLFYDYRGRRCPPSRGGYNSWCIGKETHFFIFVLVANVFSFTLIFVEALVNIKCRHCWIISAFSKFSDDFYLQLRASKIRLFLLSIRSCIGFATQAFHRDISSPVIFFSVIVVSPRPEQCID